MAHIDSKSSRPPLMGRLLIAALVLVLASLVLAACGGSSSTSSSTTSTARASATTPTTAGQPAGLRNPAAIKVFAKFAACMRQNGVDVPPPNPTNSGPIFNTKGLNTASSAFKAAELKCRKGLVSAVRGHPGAPGAGPGTGSGAANG